MRTLTLQDDEADNLEAFIDAVLAETGPKAIMDGKVRRRLRRVSMKLHWARQATGQNCDELKADREAA
jgi:hypothetical protein